MAHPGLADHLNPASQLFVTFLHHECVLRDGHNVVGVAADAQDGYAGFRQWLGVVHGIEPVTARLFIG